MHVTIQLKYHTIKSEQKCTNVKLKDKWLNNTKIIHKNMIQKQFIIRVMITYYLYDFISETYKSDLYLPPSSNSNATKGQWKKTWNNGNPFKPATLTSAHRLTLLVSFIVAFLKRIFIGNGLEWGVLRNRFCIRRCVSSTLIWRAVTIIKCRFMPARVNRKRNHEPKYIWYYSVIYVLYG